MKIGVLLTQFFRKRHAIFLFAPLKSVSLLLPGELLSAGGYLSPVEELLWYPGLMDSVQGIIEWFSNNQDDLQPAAGPGRWNDPDMVWWICLHYWSYTLTHYTTHLRGSQNPNCCLPGCIHSANLIPNYKKEVFFTAFLYLVCLGSNYQTHLQQILTQEVNTKHSLAPKRG